MNKPKLTDSVNYNLRLPRQLRDDFAAVCEENGLNGSGLIRNYIQKVIDQYKPDKKQEEK